MGMLCTKQDEKQFPQLMTDAKPFVMSMAEDERWIASMLRLMKALNVHAINMPHKDLTAPIARIFHAEGVRCSVWTVNEAEDIDRCFGLGVHNITTKTVQKALERRQAHGLKRGARV